MITRRKMITGLLGITSVPVTVVAVAAQSEAASNNRVQWVVPTGVDKINVKSWKKDGSKVMNYNFNVEPGQTFLLTAK